MLAHQLSPVQKANKVLDEPDLGDHRLSQPLAILLAHCPVVEETTAFFRASFLRRLPAELQILLDDSRENLKTLALRTDQLWLKRRPVAPVAAVEQLPDDGCFGCHPCWQEEVLHSW